MTPDPTGDDRGPDDTVETSLLDDLLSPATQTPGTSPEAAPVDAVGAPMTDDDYLDLTSHRRSRVTTGLAIALIFALGVLAGVLINRTFAPTPAPQIVYVLGDTQTPPAPATQTPSPSR